MPDRDDDDWAFGDGGFVKVYGDRLAQSSLLDCAVATRWVFFWMLSQANAAGRYRCATVAALARHANVTPAQARKAVADLEAPDPDSTSSSEQGCRIIRITGGWRVVNAAKYRVFQTKAQKEAAERKQKERDNKALKDALKKGGA